MVSLSRFTILTFLISCGPASEVIVHLPVSDNTERNLIITADDFGVSESVNQGIILAVEHGSINTISAFTNFEGSVQLLKEISTSYPDIGIGVHLNLNAGKPVSDPDSITTLVNEKGEFYDIEEFVCNLKNIREEDVRREMQAQVETLVNAGINLDHISSHYGLFSIYTPFFNMRNELAIDYAVPVRSPLPAGMVMPSVYKNLESVKLAKRLKRKLRFRSPSTAIKLNRELMLKEMMRKAEILDSLSIPHPDMVIDCFYGNPIPENLIRILDNIPAGTSELVVHLGRSIETGENARDMNPLYLRQREYELMTITSPYTDTYRSSLQISRTTFSDLSR
jgi:predicted glycoside hydrolase/deacetylase ChbG (UPF0249 family)